MERDKSKVMNDLKELIDDIPVELHLNSERTKKFVTFLNEILGFLACDEETIKKLTEENERLRAENESYAELEQGCYVTGYKKIKAATVREFAERLKEKLAYFTDEFRYFAYAEIDQIAKEMLEG